MPCAGHYLCGQQEQGGHAAVGPQCLGSLAVQTSSGALAAWAAGPVMGSLVVAGHSPLHATPPRKMKLVKRSISHHAPTGGEWER